MSTIIAKKSIGFLLASILSLGLVACDNSNKSESKQNVAPAAAEATPASSDVSLQTIKDRGVIRIAVFSDKPPFGYIDKAGINQGYDIELARRIAKDLLGDASKVEFVLTEAQAPGRGA